MSARDYPLDICGGAESRSGVMSVKNIWQAIRREGLRGIAIEAIRSWLWPPLAAGIAALIGLRGGIPWFYLFVGVTVAFAAVASGLLRFSEWRLRQAVNNKLNFESVRLGKKLDKDGHIKFLRLGFQLHNSAVFPIEFEIQSLQTEVDGKFPPKKPYAMTGVTIPPGGHGWFDDISIDMPDPPKNKSVEGKIEFTVQYGRPGRLKCILNKKLQVFVGFDEQGDAKVANWNESK